MSHGQGRIEIELHNRLRQQEAVAELGLFALKSADLQELLKNVVQTVARVLDTELCKVLELQPDGKSLLLRAGVGWKEGLVGHATVATEVDSQAGFTLLSNEPVIVADLQTESRFRGPSLLQEHGVVSGLSVVIHGDKWPFGVLGAHTRQARAFSRDDASFVQSVANILGGFIERRRVHMLYRQLVESVEDYAILTLNPAGLVTTWNIGAERLSGFRSDQMIGRPVASFYPPDEAAAGKPEQELTEAVAQGRIEHEGWRLRHDGTRFFARCSTIALKDERGILCGFSRVVRDITAQRREEESLRSVVDHSVDAIFTIDEQGLIQSCGGAVQRIFGHCCCDLVGQNINLLMPEPLRNEHGGYLRNYLRTGFARIMGSVREVTGIRKDGVPIPLEIVITEFRLDGQRFFTGILRDISPRKQLEAQLRQSQKMEAFGQLAGGVAHDFNNLLTIISGYSELVLKNLRADDPSRGFISEVHRAGERAASLTRQLLAFSRQQVLEPKVLDLNAVVADTEKMLRRLIGEDIHLHTVLAPRLDRVNVDPGQIEQVVLNLAVNARDAMPEGGKLTIETANTEVDEIYAQTNKDLKPGRYVMLTVSDTGCGMSDEVKARIFEPFFTTKGPGKGTGLGLATVFGVIKQSGGHIKVYSEPGHGTSFKIYLPVVNEKIPSSRSLHGTRITPTGDETILLVEDEDAVRLLSRRALEGLGYTILEASNGREALAICQQHACTIHLLLSDVVMPEIGGRKLAEQLTVLRPDMKVLYLSGYTSDAVVRHGVLHAEVAFLQKPFTVSSLANKVREVLDQVPGLD